MSNESTQDRDRKNDREDPHNSAMPDKENAESASDNILEENSTAPESSTPQTDDVSKTESEAAPTSDTSNSQSFGTAPSSPHEDSGNEDANFENLFESLGMPSFGGSFDQNTLPEDLLKQLESMGITMGNMPPEIEKMMQNPQSFFHSIMASFKSFMETPSGPVNWKIATEVALNHREFTKLTQGSQDTDSQSVGNEDNPLSKILQEHTQGNRHSEEDPVVTAKEARDVREALSVADLWLDTVCSLVPDIGGREAWSREQWIKNTLPAWKEMCEPVAKNATEAISNALSEQLDRMGLSDAQASASIPEFGQLFGPMNPKDLLTKMSGGIFAMQIGQALGMLSQDTFGSTDIGFPLTDTTTAALVPINVKDFAQGLQIPLEEVLQFLAVREAAYSRLYNTVPWLRSHLLNAVSDYASQISIDPDAIDEAVMSMEQSLRDSGMDPSAMEHGFAIDIFSTTHSKGQKSALTQLQTTLAIVEGWVEEVTMAATISHLPHAVQLREMLRRRRFAGTPAEQLLKALVGLEMRPKRVRDAAVLWHNVTKELGIDERDKMWSHPDVMPTPEELEDPENFLARREKQSKEDAEVDTELESLLEGTLGWADGLDPDQDSEGDARFSDNTKDS